MEVKDIDSEQYLINNTNCESPKAQEKYLYNDLSASFFEDIDVTLNNNNNMLNLLN